MPLNLAGGYGAGGGFDAMMELREALRRELQDKAVQEEAAARLAENQRQFNVKAPAEVRRTTAEAVNLEDAPQKEQRGYDQQFKIVNTQNLFNAGESALNRTHQSGMQKAGFDFTGGQNAIDRTFKTSERLGSQTFQTGENLLDRNLTRSEGAADRSNRVNLANIGGQYDIAGMNLRNAGDLASAQFRAQMRPATGEQRKDLDFYQRMQRAIGNMDKMEDQLTTQDLAIIHGSPSWLGPVNNAMLSKAGQAYAQALSDYTLAKLRDESGAAISVGEFTKEQLLAARQLADTPETLAQRRATRNGVAEGFAFKSGPAYEEYFGTPFVSKPRREAAEAAGQKTISMVDLQRIAANKQSTVEEQRARYESLGYVVK